MDKIAEIASTLAPAARAAIKHGHGCTPLRARGLCRIGLVSSFETVPARSRPLSSVITLTETGLAVRKYLNGE